MADVDSLAEIRAKLEELLSSRRKSGDDGGDDDDLDYSGKRGAERRIHQLVAQRAKAEQQLEALAGHVKELESGYEAKLKAMQEQAAASVADVRRQYDEAQRLQGLGLDEDGIAEARRKFGQLPEDGRPKTVAEWVEGLDEESAPRTLRAYLAERKTETEEAPRRRGPPRVDENRGGKQPPAKDPKSMSDDEYETWLRSTL